MRVAVIGLGYVGLPLAAAFTAATFASPLTPAGLVADIKNMWRDVELPGGLRRWTL